MTKFIPTSQYFERSFEMLQVQMEGFREGQRELKADIDKRFELVHQGQKEIRLEMDKRFEQVNKRFDQINNKLDQIMDRVDVKIDSGLREGRALTVKLFSFAMVFSAISMAGLMAKMAGLF